MMDIEILDSLRDFRILVDYNSGAYEKSTAEAFANLFCASCEEILAGKNLK